MTRLCSRVTVTARLQLDEECAAPRPGRPRRRASCGRPRLVRRDERRLHLHRLEHEQRLARLDASPAATSTPITVPGIGAVTRRCRAVPPRVRGRRRRRAASAAAGREVEPPGAAPRARGQAQAAARERRVLVRNAVVVSPARNAGWATSQRRNGRFVVDALDLGLGERGGEPVERLARGRRRARSASRSSGRRRAPISSPSSTPASTRIAVRQPQPLEPAGLRQERPRILGVQPHLDRVPVRLAARARQRLARRRCGAAARRGRGPVTSSVTGCSTWIRPFSSRKKKSRPSSMNSAVPALAVADRRARTRPRASLIARAQLRGRARAEGDSSSTFWWRRWIEQSRSPSATTVPCRRRGAGSRRGAGRST